LPRALALFLREETGTVVGIVEGSWRELVEPLLDGVIDIMIGALREQSPPGVSRTPPACGRGGGYRNACGPTLGRRPGW